MDNLSRAAAAIRRHPAMADPEIRLAAAVGDAALLTEAGKEEGFDRVVAVGGDGTVHEVVSALGVEPGPVLGVIPLGTGNDLARSLGIPLDLDEALDALGKARERTMDLVRVSGPAPCVMVNASAGGFGGRVDEEMTAEVKKTWGPLAYVRLALEVLPERDVYRVRVEVDGEPYECDALNVVVANARTVAGGVQVAPTARLDSGTVDVIVVREGEGADLASFASACLLGGHLDHDLVDHMRGSEVSVSSEPPMPFNVDGELVGQTPMRYEVVPAALRVLATDEAPAFD